MDVLLSLWTTVLALSSNWANQQSSASEWSNEAGTGGAYHAQVFDGGVFDIYSGFDDRASAVTTTWTNEEGLP